MTDGAADDRDIAAVAYSHDDDSVVVIVGSGAGGGTLGNELAHKGIDSLILEAGPRFTAEDFENDEVVMAEKFVWPDPRRATGNRPSCTAFPDSPAWLCKAVGGTTLHWTGTSVRLQDFELRARTTYGAVPGTTLMDWPLTLDDLEPYYDRAEDKLGVTGTNGIPFMPRNNNFKVFAAGARRVGYTDIHTGNYAINPEPRDGRNACDQIGFCMQGCKSGAKWSTLNVEIPKGEATGRLEVRAGCQALQVHHDDSGRVSGVLYADAAGAQHLQRARVVCIAGNAVETPRLLLNSASARFPEGLANSSGEVGRNYMTHVEGGAFGEFERPVNMHRGRTTGGWIRDEYRHEPERGFAGGYTMLCFSVGLYGLASMLRVEGWGAEYAEWLEHYDHLSACSLVGEDLPRPGNRIALDSEMKDRYGLPIPHIHQDDNVYDTAMRNHYWKRVTAVFEAVGARRVHEWRAYPTTHNMGSCRMSADPNEGVINPFGQCHDVPNLFVSDGSQFTTSGAANPTLTIVALAIRQAEHIAQKMSAGEL